MARPGQAVGLLGGSFDPAHAGHLQISREALRRFGLDRVWWLASPGNPLKPRPPAPMALRLASARRVVGGDPRIAVTGIERDLGTRFTAETLAALGRAYPGVRFVWLMGADNLASFHRWEDWQGIMGRVPVGVLARPGQRISARRSVAARRFAGARIAGRASRLLGRAEAPAWCFVNIPMRPESSTALRARGADRPGRARDGFNST